MIVSSQSKTAGFVVGQRISLFSWTDRWMRGDRFGEIVKVTRTRIHVRMDRSGQVARFHPSHINEQI